MGGVPQTLDLAADGHQLRAGAHAVRAKLRNAGVELRLEAGHPDHEELIQVRADDGQEPGALQQGIGRVLGLLQHAPLEVEQGQLAIHVELRIVQVNPGLRRG